MPGAPHAEMAAEHAAVVELDQQVFAEGLHPVNPAMAQVDRRRTCIPLFQPATAEPWLEIGGQLE